MAGDGISEHGRRIARNTVLLYVRMLVMMVIGLFSYRIILKALGISDYGVYTAVGGVVTVFMLVMNTVASAITRYITVGLGKGDPERLKTVFGTSVAIMAGFALLVALLTETIGLWYLNTKMVIPDGRMGAARMVLHSSMLVLAVNLVSIPYTAVINAHEHMDAYAYISILEAVMKLAVAGIVWYAGGDKLAVYAWLLLAVAVINRGAYALYSVRHFEECRGKYRAEGALAKEMGAFAGWNFLGSGAYMLNTQGINQLMNIFFGVGMNAARGVADKVEQIVRQFATNIALALNPQLTKSYVGGNKEYSFDLVCKGSKFYFWVLWVLAIPFLTDAESILGLWLDEVPPEAALFTRLTLVCFLFDFTPGTLNILEQAHGHIRTYYLITSGIAALCFPLAWLAFRAGAPGWTGYVIFLAVYVLKAAAMLAVAHRDTGFPVGAYFRKAVLPMVWAVLLSSLVVYPLMRLLPVTWWRFLVIAAAGVLSTGAAIWFWGLTEGEKDFVKERIHRYL